jgi:putative nucleotidyltransferase with HDIG domain
MKNGSQKTQKSRAKIDLRKTSFFALTGLLTALAIQEDFGIERLLGGFALASILLFIIYRDIMRYKPAYMKSYNMLVLLALMIVGTLALGRLSEFIFSGFSRGLGIEGARTYIFGIPLAAGAMLVTLLFDFHTAIVFSFVISMFTGLWLQDAAFSIYTFVGSLTAAFSVIRCRKRTAILRAGLYLAAVNILTVVTVLLFWGELFTSKAPYSIVFGSVSALSVVAVVSIVLPILEYLFKITTDISLLELLDLEHPLLKSLMISAPGTYHHSIIVGNLVESAAEAVNVNPLLARVCAYYHDIGKIKMPEYFIENLSTGPSKHDRLTPHMSSMILVSHVKEGVELARQYKLPMAVMEIIEQHHGTSLITYFYEKAKGAENIEELSETDYKYPGPKPQNKVAALVMIADAVDAASRVLTDPTPQRITALVNKIINHIFLEGQLEECELTLKDISEIKKHFIYTLTGILHKRIDYPGFDFNGEKGEDEGLDKQQAKTDKTRLKADKERLHEGAEPVGAQKG